MESTHRVHAVAVQDGKAIVAAGDIALITFFRSCAKPLQALPLVRSRDDLEATEIAIACASHQAEPAQLAAVWKLLARARATEDDLECGPQDGRPRDPLYHNCSGKHAGFLALCRARDWLPTGYRLPSHPAQRAMLAEIGAAAEVAVEDIPLAVDGCGVVTFALSLEAMAGAFSRLPRVDGASSVLEAMKACPELVGGEGALDTALMREAPGWVAKRGAEGLFCAVSPEGVGVALKVADGNPRALPPALGRFLATLGVTVGEDLGRSEVLNSRGDAVGEVVAE